MGRVVVDSQAINSSVDLAIGETRIPQAQFYDLLLLTTLLTPKCVNFPHQAILQFSVDTNWVSYNLIQF